MLILSRHEGETIIIDNSIVITLVRAGSEKVRIGIDAPSNVLILRGELEVYDEARRVQTKAESSQPDISIPAA